MSAPSAADRRLSRQAAALLSGGTLLAALLIGGGLLVPMAAGSGARSVRLGTGLVVLLPSLRVLLMLLSYARDGDRRGAALALLVLLAIAAGCWVGSSGLLRG